MIKKLKEKNRYNKTLFLFALSVLCLCFSLFRCFYTNTVFFLFLNWNLFLTFITWTLTSLVIVYPRIQRSKISVYILLFFWILFFPNAPYILTDLFHLRIKSSMPVWFYLVLILSFAWTGLLFGFLSLLDIKIILKKNIKKGYVIAIISGLLFLSSFGVYIGRYLRWNSWDIISEPLHLTYDIYDRFINPNIHPGTWGLTIFMGIFLNMIYWSFGLIKRKIT